MFAICCKQSRPRIRTQTKVTKAFRVFNQHKMTYMYKYTYIYVHIHTDNTYTYISVRVSIYLYLLIYLRIYIQCIQHIISGSGIQSVRRTGKYLWSLEARQSTLDRPDKYDSCKRGEVVQTHFVIAEESQFLNIQLI